MKFSRTVQFNAVPEWSSYYIGYSNLKKLIHSLEADAATRLALGHHDAERISLIPHEESTAEYDAIFRRALDDELDKICRFYSEKERDSLAKLERLQKDIHDFHVRAGVDEASTSSGSSYTARRHSDVESVAIERREMVDKNGDTMSMDDYHEGDEQFSELSDLKITLKKRAIALYVSLSELRSYVQLNRTGFGKALKKYAKCIGREMSGNYVLDVVEQSYPFLHSTREALEEKIAEVASLYASISTQGDIGQAKLELRVHLREYVVWERNTVWREMMGIEKNIQGVGLTNQGLLVSSNPITDALEHKGILSQPPIVIYTRFGVIRLPRLLFNSTFAILAIVVAVFIALLTAPIFDQPEQQSCLAILIAASLLWATEVIPLFVTSILVPLLIIVFRAVRSDDVYHERLSAPDATKYIFAAMWTPVIMLLLGGFAIAAALSKYNIAKIIATWVLSNAGTQPRNVLLTTMFVAMFLSMWISNVAAPVLCLSIIQPLLRTQDTSSNFPKALILGIALASNVGGMASPIASPQNIIALQNMYPNPSWLAWFFIAVPVCITSILLIWLMMVVTLNPAKGAIITKIQRSNEKLNRTQIFVSAVTLLTIALWCVSRQVESIFGDMGVLAIIPLVVFFGTGLLTKEDFNNFMWTIIILAMGGIALGKAVSSSGLLDTIAIGIRSVVSGMGIYGVMVVFGSLILIIATFISHTVAALILLPIVAQVGQAMDDPRPNLLVMGAALLCSCAMGLPTSGFPNVTAICTTDDQGRPYLSVALFITRGVPASVLAYIVIITLGFGLMKIVGL
ncbi:SPX domain-containing protein [Lipomyces tetrasporus]|uniref:SPX domain-containing protein n=1 Tax=Lipomyces tetrasporus TaxID=54092 RepID=A0AAD7QT58_9ASCO|nr:SPX domain-containing protein [Lipomyces tetrasporus]KAJ8101037.1 SPX domain-containing protein [Lipomyces tetrasporus]